MVADFLISHREDKDSEHYQELEAAMKDAAATMYIGGHFEAVILLRANCYDSIAGAETVRHHAILNQGKTLMILCAPRLQQRCILSFSL